jgi:Flp pilus assembly protein TadD
MEESAYTLLQRGRHLLETNNPAQAACVLERAHELEPEKKSIIEPLAIALYNFGKYVEAQAHFERLVDLDPSNSYAHFGLGMCLKKAGDRVRARGHFKLACAMEPESKLYSRALARCR